MLEKAIKVEFEDHTKLIELYGEREQNLRLIEKELDIEIHSRANNLVLLGEKEKIENAETLIQIMSNHIKSSSKNSNLELKSLIKLMSSSQSTVENIIKDSFYIKTRKKSIIPANNSQLEYINLMNNKEIVIAAGPAGTGKTYLAVAVAVHHFLNHKVEKIILSRPAVEAGEKIGLLPGNIKEKVDPYLRPLYDSLEDMLGVEYLNRCMEIGTIEIAPLAFMRGRTLNNSFIILDEAQNATVSQMKMFLTRLGKNSHMIISGDPSQSDLPKNITSGLIDAMTRLESIQEIGLKYFVQEDIIRNKLTSRIIQAYEL